MAPEFIDHCTDCGADREPGSRYALCRPCRLARKKAKPHTAATRHRSRAERLQQTYDQLHIRALLDRRPSCLTNTTKRLIL